MINILKQRVVILTKQKNILVSELTNPDNLKSDFIIHQSKLLQQVENRLDEVNTLLLLIQDKNN